MSLAKRKDSDFWWYDFSVHGHRFRGSTESSDLNQAKAIEAKLRTDALMSGHFGQQKERIALDALLGRYWIDYARHLKSGKIAVRYHCRHILDHFGKAAMLHELDDAGVSSLKAKLRGRVSDSSVNRVLSTLRKLINVATEEWGYEGPSLKIKKHMLTEPEARTRWLTVTEADRLIDCAAEHLKNPIRFALLTGVRLANILNLRWEDIRLDQEEIEFRIKSNIPGGKLLVLPISQELRQLLQTCGPVAEGFVFLRRFKSEERPPERIKKFRRSFKTACDGAGIANFRFHDLRHTAATWMIQRGVPIDLVQDILGHTDIATTKKYAHRDFSEKRLALEKLSMARIRHVSGVRSLPAPPKLLNYLVGARGFEPPTPSPPGKPTFQELIEYSGPCAEYLE